MTDPKAPDQTLTAVMTRAVSHAYNNGREDTCYELRAMFLNQLPRTSVRLSTGTYVHMNDVLRMIEEVRMNRDTPQDN